MISTKCMHFEDLQEIVDNMHRLGQPLLRREGGTSVPANIWVRVFFKKQRTQRTLTVKIHRPPYWRGEPRPTHNLKGEPLETMSLEEFTEATTRGANSTLTTRSLETQMMSEVPRDWAVEAQWLNVKVQWALGEADRVVDEVIRLGKEQWAASIDPIALRQVLSGIRCSQMRAAVESAIKGSSFSKVASRYQVSLKQLRRQVGDALRQMREPASVLTI